jgi:hypothetical protein
MTTEPSQSTANRRLFRLPAEDWTKIILGAAVGVAICLFGFWINAKSPNLRKTVSETVTFQGDKNQFGLSTCSVVNDGNKEAEDVTCSFNFPSQAEVRVTPENLRAKAEVAKNGNVLVQVGTLNPGESFQVSAMTTTPGSLPAKVIFVVRGKGIVGVEVQPAPSANWIVVLVIAGFAFLIGASWQAERYQRQIARYEEQVQAILPRLMQQVAALRDRADRLQLPDQQTPPPESSPP